MYAEDVYASAHVHTYVNIKVFLHVNIKVLPFLYCIGIDKLSVEQRQKTQVIIGSDRK